MTRTDRNQYKMSVIYEVKKFLSRKVCITTKRSSVKYKRRNPVPIKWVFKSKEETDGLIRLKQRNVVKGYMQVARVDFTESFQTLESDTPTRILIVLTLYHEEDEWIVGLCELEEALLHHNMEVDMFIECTKCILELGIITKDILEYY